MPSDFEVPSVTRYFGAFAIALLVSFVWAPSLVADISVIAFTAGSFRDHRMDPQLPIGGARRKVADALLCIVIAPREFAGSGIEVYNWHRPDQKAVWPVATCGEWVAFMLPVGSIRGIDSVLRPLELGELRDLRVIAQHGGGSYALSDVPSGVPDEARKLWPYLLHHDFLVEVATLARDIEGEVAGVKLTSDEAIVHVITPARFAGRKIRILLPSGEGMVDGGDPGAFRTVGHQVRFLVSAENVRELLQGLDFIPAQEMRLIDPDGATYAEFWRAIGSISTRGEALTPN